eukprot:2722228-Ditylum_brightwellii.AAC.1
MENVQNEDLLSVAAMKATRAKTIYTYQEKFEFLVPDNAELYELRRHFNDLVQEMKRVDRDIPVGAIKGGKSWTTARDIPTGE